MPRAHVKVAPTLLIVCLNIDVLNLWGKNGTICKYLITTLYNQVLKCHVTFEITFPSCSAFFFGTLTQAAKHSRHRDAAAAAVSLLGDSD